MPNKLKLVSDFSWIDLGRLSDVRDIRIETLSSDGAWEYMGESRIEAIADAVQKRIRHVQELPLTQTHTQTDSVDDDVTKNVAEDYTP